VPAVPTSARLVIAITKVKVSLADVRRSLNLILLDDGAGLILDVIRFVVLGVLIVARLLRYIQISRQLGPGRRSGCSSQRSDTGSRRILPERIGI
jgi:hypothetical protein